MDEEPGILDTLPPAFPVSVNRSTIMQWNFPLYLLPHESGYISIIPESELGSDPPQSMALAVFTSEEEATRFLYELEILSRPKALNNAREFAWFLQSLHDPVNQIMVDPPGRTDGRKPTYQGPIRDVLENQLVVDHSPWNYPIYVAQSETGFVSVEGPTSRGDVMKALALFTQSEKAEVYLEQANHEAELIELPTMQQARDLLVAMFSEAEAVALDPEWDEGQPKAKYCMGIHTLLKKYLVIDEGDAQSEATGEDA